MSETLEKPVRTMSFIGGDGHITFGWESSKDDEIIPMIEDLLKKNVRFMVLHQGWNGERLKPLTSVDDIGADRHVYIHDDDAREFVGKNKSIIKIIDDKHRESLKVQSTSHYSTDAREIARNDTIAHRGYAPG